MTLKEGGLRGSIRNVGVGVEVSAIPDSGASHQWNHDDGSGTTLTDANGSLDGTINGATWVTGSGGAGDAYLSYDATDDNTDLGTASQSDFNHFVQSGAGTLFAWVNTNTTSSDQSVISAGDFSGAAACVHLVIESGSWRVLIADGSNVVIAINPSTSPPTNEWVAVALTADGSSAELFQATASNNYSLNSLGTDTVANGAQVDLDTNVHFGYESFNDRWNWDGEQDIIWKDETGFSQSNIQSFVDDTKSFY